MKLAEALSQFRLGKKMSIKDLAQNAGLSADEFQAVEQGNAPSPGVRKWLDQNRDEFQEVDDFPAARPEQRADSA